MKTDNKCLIKYSVVINTLYDIIADTADDLQRKRITEVKK